MSHYLLTFKLKSDGAFGRGDGVAGYLNQEVQHDAYGCPYLGGKALKGILVNECADILMALPETGRKPWEDAANYLFGHPSSTLDSQPLLHIGDACLPMGIREAIRADMDAKTPTLTRELVLHSLTALRHQTAIDGDSGVAKENTLRTVRVVLRETSFMAPLLMTDYAENRAMDQMLMLLAATAKAFRRAGTTRNRGYGRISEVRLTDLNYKDLTSHYFNKFCVEVQS